VGEQLSHLFRQKHTMNGAFGMPLAFFSSAKTPLPFDAMMITNVGWISTEIGDVRMELENIKISIVAHSSCRA
jgi:hypothetical protein